jgi:dTDP-4-dehydrorhamnose reductase
VTGATGQVGRALREIAPAFRYFDRTGLDLEDIDQIREQLGSADSVVHLGAMTDVDRCEREPELAWRVNAVATEAVAATGARIVYVSTDYVFDGDKTEPYVESDEPRPLNAYGRSKLHGERCVLGSGRGVVVRTSWIYGHGRNFVRTILGAATTHSHLHVVHDQVGRPTHAADIAGAVLAALSDDTQGIVHLSGDGPPCSWADLAEFALDCAGIDTSVEKVSTARYEEITQRPLAPRPANSLLSLERARTLGWPVGHWRDSVKSYVMEEQ